MKKILVFMLAACGLFAAVPVRAAPPDQSINQAIDSPAVVLALDSPKVHASPAEAVTLAIETLAMPAPNSADSDAECPVEVALVPRDLVRNVGHRHYPRAIATSYELRRARPFVKDVGKLSPLHALAPALA